MLLRTLLTAVLACYMLKMCSESCKEHFRFLFYDISDRFTGQDVGV